MEKLRLFIILFFLSPFSFIKAQTALKRPNIIFILADDLGYETLQVNGGTSYKTPYLDKMAAQGMRFTQAHAQPLCSPSRVQVMTGKYNHRNYRAFGIIDSNEVTFAHLLKHAGYKTGITGKWQLLGNSRQQQLAGRRGAYPNEMGFDNYYVWHVESVERESRYKDPIIFSEKGKKEYKNQYGPDLFLNWAKDFIEENKDSTFFLYYPMVLVHDPFQVTPATPAFASSKSTDISDTKNFGAMVSYMDRQVNEIITKVKQSGIADNTLIVFTGDNGTSVEVVSDWNGQKIRGAKGSATQWGTHVPLIAYWRGKIKPGTVNENLIDFTDILPTFLEAAKEPIPLTFNTDGISFYNQLISKAGAPKRDWVFGYYEPKWGRFKNAVWIQDGRWKLYQTGEFYNLEKDPLETSPIASESLTEEQKQIKDRFEREITKKLN